MGVKGKRVTAVTFSERAIGSRCWGILWQAFHNDSRLLHRYQFTLGARISIAEPLSLGYSIQR
jgi:hypothetical protein